MNNLSSWPYVFTLLVIIAAVAYKHATKPQEPSPAVPAEGDLSREGSGHSEGGEPMADQGDRARLLEPLPYGFRYDPMKFVEEGEGLQAALVRKQVFGRPKEGDEATIQVAIDETLAEQGEKGNLCDDENDVGATGVRFLRLLTFGCPPDRPEMQRAADFILSREREPDGTYGLYGILALSITRPSGDEALAASVRTLAAKFDGQFWEGCPFTPGVQLRALWAGRKAADVADALARGLTWIADRTAACGCVPGKYQWEFLACAALMEHPAGRAIVEKSLPMILRAQQADGGWGAALIAFQALTKYGLLDPLRERPPLPPDWRIVSSIPAPAEGATGLAWQEGLLWTAAPEKGELVALSPEDGRVQRTLELDNLSAVSTWDGALAAVQAEPYGLHRIVADTGEVVRSVQGHAAYSTGLRAYATRNSTKKTCELWDAPVEQVTDAGDAVWYRSGFAGMLIRIDSHQNVLDWGENPFDESSGLAHDRQNLWVLDSRNKRICMIEKALQLPEHGFRYDPMKWAASDDSVPAALVRKHVFGEPKPGDEELLRKRIEEILAGQQPDGSLGDGAADKLLELLELGCPTDRAELKRAMDALCESWVPLRDNPLPAHVNVGHMKALRVAVLGNWRGPDVLAPCAKEVAVGMGEPRQWCPWSPGNHLTTLWACRNLADVKPAVDQWMTALWEKTNAAGCWIDFYPWSIFEGISAVEHPLAPVLVARLLPFLLRAQEPDGSWGAGSFTVFRALHAHGLLSTLRGLSPLPPDGRVAHSVPAPAGDTSTMTWGDDKLWVLEKGAKELIAVSPKDGSVLRRLRVPTEEPGGIGWYQGQLVLSAGGTEHHETKPRLLLVDPENGDVTNEVPVRGNWGPGGSALVGDELWVAQGVWLIVKNLATGDERRVEGYGPWPIDLAAAGNTLWYTDEWMPCGLFHVDLEGGLLEFVDAPFYERWEYGLAVRGIAHDGKNLWALDNKNKRICIIERTESGEELARAAIRAGKGYLRDWLICGPFTTRGLTVEERNRIAEAGYPHVHMLRGGHLTDFLEAIGGEAEARPADGDAVPSAGGEAVQWQKYVSPANVVRFEDMLGLEYSDGWPYDFVVMYGYTTINSPEERRTYLEIGTDDSGKLYLNGEPVHDSHVVHCTTHRDFVPVTLKKGQNTILIKADNCGGPGGFIVRVVDEPARAVAMLSRSIEEFEKKYDALGEFLAAHGIDYTLRSDPKTLVFRVDPPEYERAQRVLSEAVRAGKVEAELPEERP